MRSPTLDLHAVAPHVEVLGPGPCAVVWVQYCPLACRGCMSPASWSREAGVRAEIEAVAAWLDDLPLSKLTISGGEPFEQARPLAALVDRLRSLGDWIVSVYSGYRRELLERELRPGSRALLERIDLLVDGPYREDLRAPLLWRGSSNQRLHRLSDRVLLPATDTPSGVEFTMRSDGSFELVGVPPEPLSDELQALLDGDGPSAAAERFPFPLIEE
jgi:anaerobic ribonucleoside-triphosphate reductase activating protein